MLLNILIVCALLATVVLIISLEAFGLLSTGLQEADDPSESRPEDLTEFEKRHTHRADVSH